MFDLTGWEIISIGCIIGAVWLFIVARNLLRARHLFWWWMFVILFWSLIRARRLEPSIIRVQETLIPFGVSKEIVLIADMHLGVFKDAAFMQRVVNRINGLSWVDLILIAGDFTFEPTTDQKLEELFAPLSQLRAPVYAVLGNHDVQKPGPDLTAELVNVLTKHGVKLLDNDIIWLGDSYLVWLDGLYTENGDLSLLRELAHDKPSIVLSHSPDITLSYTADERADLTLVGHTHCGQIRLPFIYKRFIPTRWDFDCGFSHERLTELYITPWLGEVILPMRFLNPPTIDLLHLY